MYIVFIKTTNPPAEMHLAWGCVIVRTVTELSAVTEHGYSTCKTNNLEKGDVQNSLIWDFHF